MCLRDWSVSLDQHETDPSHRFKAAYDGPGMRAALAHSGDGIHWTPYNNGQPVTKRAADTCNQIFWDPHARLYRLFTRTDFGAAGGTGEIRGARSMTNTDVKADIGLPKGTWIHVASVLKDDRVTMYLNGVAQTSYVGDNGKGKGRLKVAGTNVDFVDANTSFSGFGGEGRVRNDPWYFYNGLADDVAVWNVPLTSKQIAALATGAATPTTPPPITPTFACDFIPFVVIWATLFYPCCGGYRAFCRYRASDPIGSAIF